MDINPLIPDKPEFSSTGEQQPLQPGLGEKIEAAKDLLSDHLKTQSQALTQIMHEAQAQIESNPAEREQIVSKANAQVKTSVDDFFENLPPGAQANLHDITQDQHDAVVGAMKHEMQSNYDAQELSSYPPHVTKATDAINQAIGQKYGPEASIENIGLFSPDIFNLIHAFYHAPNALAADAVFSQIQLALGVGNTSSSSQSQVDPKQIDTLVQNFIQRCQFSGSVMVMQHGQVVFSKGYGEATKGVPNSPLTTYRWGSLSKVVTSTAILQLRETKGLDLDAPITQYLPAYADPNKYPGIAGGPPYLTIRSLLTMTSGIAGLPPTNWLDHPPSLDEAIACAGSLPRIGQGTYVYSNTSFNILAKVIEVVTGQSYESYVNANIFKPAGMTSAIAPEARAEDTPEASSHIWVDGKSLELTQDQFFQYPDFTAMRIGTGNIIGSPIDLEKFNWALEHGSGSNPPLINAEDLAMMQTQQMGWSHGSFSVNGVPYVEKNGSVQGELNLYMRFPDSDTSIVITANIDPKPPLTPETYLQPLGTAIAELLFPKAY